MERKDAAAIPALTALLKSGGPVSKVHALWALEGIGTPAPQAITAALHDANPKVRAAAVFMADRTAGSELAQLIDDPEVEVQVALAFTLAPWPEAQQAVIALARKAGGDLRVRDALLSGLRGRELEVLEALLEHKAGVTAPSASEPILAALAQAVMTEKRSARVKQLLTIIAAQTKNSPDQLALLIGAAGKASAKAVGKPKLLYLDAEAPELAALTASADAKAKPLVAALDARVAWPNKPGFPPPPVIIPLNAEEQALFETGKTVYATLCGACHQPTGVGMPGLAPALVDSDWVLGNPKVIPRIIINGLSGPIKVGTQEWSLEMPPLGPALSDEQIAGVVTYIRREWEHTGSPMLPKDVAEIRAQHKDRTIAWSSAELAALEKPAAGPKKAAAPKQPGADPDSTAPESQATSQKRHPSARHGAYTASPIRAAARVEFSAVHELRPRAGARAPHSKSRER